MKGFLLDTNVPSETVRPAPDARVVAWIEAPPLESLFLSVVSFGEWHKGLALLPPSKRRAELEEWLHMKVMKLFSGRILSMTEAIAGRWGALEGQRQRHRGEGYGRAAAGASAAQLPSGGAAGDRPDAECEGGRQQNDDTDGHSGRGTQPATPGAWQWSARGDHRFNDKHTPGDALWPMTGPRPAGSAYCPA